MGVKPWRDAASVIMFAKNATISSKKILSSSSSFDYKLLMLRRSGKSQFMPNAYVFPGGVSSPADLDKEWLTLFKMFGKRGYEEALVKTAHRPFLMSPRPDDGIPRDLAFRICALRETFEESGIFLGDGKKIPADELLLYRPQVHVDPKQFLKMCQLFEVCPDIWSLREWSDWLTPIGLDEPGNRRFDTLFYTTFLEDVGTASLDGTEITDTCWTDPDSILRDCREEKLWLAPPQVYELYQFSKFKKFDDLRDVCIKRDKAGVLTWMPVFYKCKDGMLSLLPGDELYPETPDYLGAIKTEQSKTGATVSEMNLKFPKTNRLAIYSKNNLVPYTSICDK